MRHLTLLTITLGLLGSPVAGRCDPPPLNGAWPQLWYSLSVDGGPIKYLNSLSGVSAWRTRGDRGCVSALRPGDALKITRGLRGAPCTLETAEMSGRALIAFGLKLNLNRASYDELIAVRGVGPKLAHQLINGRPWRALKHLTRLKGVGSKRLRRLSQHLRVSPLPLISLSSGAHHER